MPLRDTPGRMMKLAATSPRWLPTRSLRISIRMAGGVDVETPNRQGFSEQVLDARVALEPRHVVDVDLGSDLGLVLGDEVDGVADLPSPRWLRMSNLYRPTSSATTMSNCVVGKPLGSMNVPPKWWMESSTWGCHTRGWSGRLGNPGGSRRTAPRASMSSVPGGRSLPSAMRSMSCLGRPKTFPNSRMTAR